MKNIKNKKSQSEIGLAIISLIVLTSSVFLAGNITLNDSFVSDFEFNNILEKTIEIEVWADTLIELNIEQNNFSAKLLYDNQTIILNQELEFYLDESLVTTEKINPENYKSTFNLYNISPGTYSIEIIFQGSDIFYLNSSILETQIEIIDINGTKEIILLEELKIPEINITLELNNTNQTLLNETNLTLELNVTNISLEGFICEEFTDNVLFSSGYTHDEEGSTNYEVWTAQITCAEAGGQDCSLYNVNTKSRVLYLNPYDEGLIGEGSVQISELDNSDCDSPEKEEYTEYVLYDTPSEESDKEWERYCEKNKTQDSECEIEESENYYEESICYGVKTFASQYSIVDVVEIKYTWCWEDAR